MANITLTGILEKMTGKDKDYRYMATSDLLNELNKDTFKADAELEIKLANIIIQQLDDAAGDVSGLAVKCLAPLVRKVSEPRVVEMTSKLCEKLLNGKDQHRDIASIALKTIVAEVSTKSVAQSILVSLSPQLINGITGPGMSSEIKCECLDILCEILHKFGNLMTSDHELLLSALLSQLSSNQASIRKKTVACIASLSSSLSDDLLARATVQVVMNLKNKATKSELTRTNIQMIGALSRAVGYRFGPHLGETVPVLIDYCTSASENDEELREYSLQALESFLLRCPRDISFYCDEILHLTLKYLSYDPNFTDTMDEDTDDEQHEEEEDDESANEYTDDEDASWKVRRAAAKCLAALIVSRPEMLSKLYEEACPKLIDRCKEREENVKMDVFNTFIELLRQTGNVTKGQIDVNETSPRWLLKQEVPKIVRSLNRQLREKSIKTKVGAFSVLKELVVVLPDCLADHIGSLIPGIEKALNDKSSTSNLKIEALTFTRLVLSSHSPAVFHPYIKALSAPVLSAVGERYYKVTAEALRVCGELVRVVRPQIEGSGFDFRPYVHPIYKAIMSRLINQDQDQEVKECAISCMGLVVSTFGDHLNADLPACLPVLVDRMGNEITRLTAVKGWIKLLRQMVLKLPEVSNLKSLVALCSEDAEVDFFNNIVDPKLHRRVRALSRFRNIISTNKMSEVIIKKVFLPLFFNMLFDEQEGKAEHMKNACIESIASVAGQMEWKSYYALLTRCFRGISSSSDRNKVFIRLICSILDSYHFSETSHPKEPPLDAASDSGTAVTSSFAASRDHGASVVDTEIQTCLSAVVFPKIQKLLNSDSEKVNVKVSLAALKVLKLLPADAMDLHLSSIVHRISNFLKHRLESIRDEARSALATCLKELGLEYLQFIVKVLQATLKRGYELHVLGYTLNFILSKCLLNPVNGKLDYCLGDLLYVIEMDVLGDVAEEKDVEKIASKMKETRKKKSFETLKLIAQNITFKSYAPKLLAPVTTHIQKNITPKVKAKLENMLQHIAAGIECNPSVDETDLFMFIYGLVEDGIKDKICQPENKLINVVNKPSCIDANKKSRSRGVEGGSLCSHLIRVFALRILHKHVKGMKQNMKDANILSLLDPFVSILSECLRSRYEDIVSASLGCLTVLVRLPLPSLQSQAERLKASLLNIAHTTVNSSSPLMQSCLTLLTVLLRSTNITLTPDQLHLLIQLPLFVDLERNQSPVALSLLKGIVMRQLEVHEIYYLMTRVRELMVTSQLESIRKKCSEIFLQYLFGYPLPGERLQNHLGFLLANLGYEYSTGRKSVLEMIHAIIVKFPRSVLDEQSQILFVHLVLCLANDSDDSVRSMSGAAIKGLIASISPNSLNTVIEYALTWYLGEEQKFWGVAAQVLGLLIEVLKKGFDRHTNTILPVTRRILLSSVDAINDRNVDSSESSIPHWKEAYYSLVMLEKLIHQFNELCFARDLEVIWDAICQMLLHPHSWIRNRSVHLIAQYFALVVDACKGHRQKSLASFYLMSPSKLFHIAASLCCQLKTPLMDDADAHLMNQSIVFAVCGVYSVMGHIAPVDPSVFWSSLEQHKKDRFLKAFDLLDSRKGRVLFLPNTSNVHEQNNQQSAHNIQHILVSILLRKMGKIALQMETCQMGIVFDSFKSIMSQMSQDDCLHYASEVLLPLYKVCEGLAGKVIPDNVKQLAEESLEKVQNILGTQNFVQVYNLVGKKLKAKRDKKKQEDKIMAVINPMRHAKRKMRISFKHRANKKRKIMTLKMARWMH